MLETKDERVVNCIKAALKWAKKHNVRWLESEKKVYSKVHKVCGTLDGLAKVDSCSDTLCCSEGFKDRLCVIDFKSSNYLHLEYIFQVSAYKAFYMEEHKINIQECYILRLGKEDGEVETWRLEETDFEEDFEGFLACLELSRIKDRIDERIRARKAETRAAKKAARAEAKEASKVAEKLKKAAEKAEKKLKQAEEKARVKAEAKAERERLRAETKAAKEARLVNPPIETLVLSPADTEVFVETITNPPEPNDAAKVAAKRYTSMVTEEDMDNEYTPASIPKEEE